MQTVNDHIYEMLREEIFNGMFKPGDLLRQEMIASRYGVSHVPVREAMSRLEGDGLVEVRPRRGFAVRGMTEASLSELFDLRKFLELYAVDAAGRRLFETSILSLRPLFEEMRRCDLATAAGRDSWAALNRRFHTELFTVADLEEFPRLYRKIADRVEYFTRLDIFSTGDAIVADEEHAQLIDAVERQDRPQMKEIIARHCDNTKKRLLEHLVYPQQQRA